MAKHLDELKVIALFQARGRGSTLPDKNMYPLNGKPMIAHFLEEIKRVGFIDGIGVWTESDDVARLVEDYGCQALERPRGMVHYGSGFHSPFEWHMSIENQVEKIFGPPPYVRVWLNCNHVLFSAGSLEAMYDRFINDDSADIIFPMCRIEPDLFMVNPNTKTLFPVLFQSPHLMKAKERFSLFRKVGMHISVYGMETNKRRLHEIYHEVPWYEGRDIQEYEDTFFAEYLLKKRGGE